MSIVGQASKQPEEIDVYAIDYTDDLVVTDAPATAFSFALVKGQVSALQNIAASASVSTPLKRYLLSGGAVLTLTGMNIGDRVYVCNKEPVTAATIASADTVDGVASITLLAMRAVALIKTATGWVTEIAVRNIVDVTDKRVRNEITGGTSGVTYKIETTTTTAEGRVLQDEILVKVKDI